jgi:hypothetical protein
VLMFVTKHPRVAGGARSEMVGPASNVALAHPVAMLVVLPVGADTPGCIGVQKAARAAWKVHVHEAAQMN